jgi:pimeloyl-ACP methyl ester carboxylesterase
MQSISRAVQEGAGAYLTRQYTIIGGVAVVIAIVLAIALDLRTAIGFLIGGAFSGSAGFIGMNVSVRANARVAETARRGVSAALEVAFKGGAVTGLLVAGLALLGVAGYYGLLILTGTDEKDAIDALVGLGFGGWIAAEMASMAPADLSHLVLAGAMGIKPPVGDILDLAVTGYVDYARAGFHDQKAFDRVYGAEPSVDQLEMWDICREMSFRIAWKPYMYSQTLPHLLGGAKAPALLVWGAEDRVVPPSAAELYAARLPEARLEVVPDCGHCVEMEKPAELARLVTAFAGRG